MQDTPDTADTPTTAITTPKGDGRFRGGVEWKGNKEGRPKGIKNRITVQRLLMEEKLREQLGVNAEQLVAQAILMALNGNDRVMRVLLDKLLSTPKNSDDADSKDNSIQVVITNLTNPSSPQASQRVLPSGKVRVISAETPVDGELIKNVDRREA